MNVARITHTAPTVYIFHTLKIQRYLVIAQGPGFLVDHPPTIYSVLYKHIIIICHPPPTHPLTHPPSPPPHPTTPKGIHTYIHKGSSVPIAYCLLHIAYCLLPIVAYYCLLLIAYCLYCLLPIAYCILPIIAIIGNRQ